MVEHLHRGYGEFIFLEHDGSVLKGFEIVTHPATLKFHKQWKWANMLKTLSQKGFVSHNKGNCGLHVHMSKAFFTPEEQIKIGYFLYSNKFNVLTFARRDDSEYATFMNRVSIPTDDYNNINMSMSRHYDAISYRNRDTIELRFFRGTLNVITFYAALEFVHAIANYIKVLDDKVIIDSVKSWAGFCTYISKYKKTIYKNLYSYMIARQIFTSKNMFL